MDYVGEQEMEMEALEAILMDDMKELDGSVRDQQAAIPPEACAGQGLREKAGALEAGGTAPQASKHDSYERMCAIL
jgi:hypothetical protein